MADRRFLYEMAPALVVFSCSVPASIDRNVKQCDSRDCFYKSNGYHTIRSHRQNLQEGEKTAGPAESVA
jgi:hypothetical protein